MSFARLTEVIRQTDHEIQAILDQVEAKLTRELSGGVSVESHGAVGDVTTDDTLAIQSAINEAQALGTAVIFREGHKYKITGTLEIGDGFSGSPSTKNGLKLLGQGDGPTDSELTPPGDYHYPTSLLWDGPAGGTMIQFNGPIGGIRIEGIQFEAKLGSNAAATVLDLRHVMNSEFRNLTMMHNTGLAIIQTSYHTGAADGANDNLFINVRIQPNVAGGGKAIRIGNELYGAGGILDVARNTYINCNFMGDIELRSMDSCTFINIQGGALKIYPPADNLALPMGCSFYNCPMLIDSSTGANWAGANGMQFFPHPTVDIPGAPSALWASGITSDGILFGPKFTVDTGLEFGSNGRIIGRLPIHGEASGNDAFARLGKLSTVGSAEIGIQLGRSGPTSGVAIIQAAKEGVGAHNLSVQPSGGNLIIGAATSGLSKVEINHSLAAPSTIGDDPSGFLRLVDVAGSRSFVFGVSPSMAWLTSFDKNDNSIHYDIGINPDGGKVLFGGQLQSPSYVSQTTGWAIGSAGAADFRHLYTDNLQAKSFILDLEQALAGGQIISKSVAEVALDFTLPAAGGAASLTVNDLPSAPNMAVFQSGDIVRLRQFSRAGGALTIADAWGVVTSYLDNAGGTQSWTFTRSSGALAGTASGTISAKTLALDYGTTGNGIYEVNAIDGIYGVNAPYWQINTWATHPQNGQVVRVRGGNLKGITGVTEYGLYAGDGSILDTNRYLRITDQNFELKNLGLKIYQGVELAISLEPTIPYLALGNPMPTTYLQNSTSGIWMGHTGSSVYKLRIGTTNESGVLTAGLTWDGTALNVIGSGTFSGTVTATAGAIGGFSIGADYIRDTVDSFGLASTVTGGDDVRFWAGATFANRATAPFRLTESGVLWAASNVIRMDETGLAVFSTNNDQFVAFYQGADGVGKLWADTSYRMNMLSFNPTTGPSAVALHALNIDGGSANFNLMKPSGAGAHAILFSSSSELTGFLIGNVNTSVTPNAMLDVRGALQINLNSGVPPAGLTGTVFQLAGANSTNTRMLFDTFGTANPAFDFRRAPGTMASPTPIQSGDNLGQLNWLGYGATAYSSGARAAIRAAAMQTWTDSVQSTYISFLTAPTGSASSAEAMRLTGDKNLGLIATAFGASASGVFGIANGIEPTTSPADMLQIYCVDLSAGNATLGLRTETAVVTEAVVSDRTLSIKVNGVVYKVLLKS